MVKNTIQLCRKFILHKINENMKRNNLCIGGYDVTCVKFKALQLYNFVKTDQNTTKLCTRFIHHKINRNMS